MSYEHNIFHAGSGDLFDELGCHILNRELAGDTGSFSPHPGHEAAALPKARRFVCVTPRSCRPHTAAQTIAVHKGVVKPLGFHSTHALR